MRQTGGACGAGGGGSSYVDTAAVASGQTVFVAGKGATPGAPSRLISGMEGWGLSDHDGHVLLELYGSELHVGDGCGITSSAAAKSCVHIRNACTNSSSGMLWLKPSTGQARQYYCNMNEFGGGWTLVGYFCPECDELDSVADAQGEFPIFSDQRKSARFADKDIQAFGSSTFWVKADADRSGKTANCSTFYRLLEPITFDSTQPFNALQCSVNNMVYGPAYRPEGVGLTTQSGPRNWAKSFCGNPTKQSSQWVYTYPPQSVNGRDLCVNGGDMLNSYKWLYLRPNDMDKVTVSAWRVVQPRSSKVICNDGTRWPADGHPPFMADDMHIADCKAACEVQPNCTAIEFSPNYNGAIDETGRLRSKCFFHTSPSACNNFRSFSSPTYEFEFWELPDAKPSTTLAAPNTLPACSGNWANIASIPRTTVADLLAADLERNIKNMTLTQLQNRVLDESSAIIMLLQHQVSASVRFSGLVYNESWAMYHGDGFRTAVSQVTNTAADSIVITSIVPGSVNINFTIAALGPQHAESVAFRLNKAVQDGSLAEATADHGIECRASDDCKVTGHPAVVSVLLSSRLADLIQRIESKDKFVEVFRQLLDEELRVLSDDELEVRVRADETAAHVESAGLLDREASVERIKGLSVKDKTTAQMKELLQGRLLSNPLQKSSDRRGCVGDLGLSFCYSQGRCVQNWDGGLFGPCTAESKEEPYVQTLTRTELEQTLRQLMGFTWSRKSTGELKELLVQTDPSHIPQSRVARTKSVGLEPDFDITACPPHSHDFPFCSCDAGYAGHINVVRKEGSCDLVPCPQFSDSHPLCMCIHGHYGSISWNPQLQRYDGVCQPCGQGYRTTTSGCIKVDGPDYSEAHPNARCIKGFAGSITWDVVSESFVGACTPCGTGFTSDDGSDCRRVACPAHSFGWPVCECTAGMSGEISWGGFSWVGQCVPCPAGSFKTASGNSKCQPCKTGFWSLSSSTECFRVGCPANSTGHPACSCSDDYIGKILWQPASGLFSGHCVPGCEKGFTASDDRMKCIPFECPENAVWPSCSCRDGFYGEVFVSGDGATIQGKCNRCPNSTWCSGPKCVTKTSCRPVSCPERSVLKHDLVSDKYSCECEDGLVGNLVFDQDAAVVRGTCRPCPPMQWSDSTAKLTSDKCEAIECPHGAEGYPYCRCKLGYVGSVAWVADLGVWSGGCAKCPHGMWSEFKSDVSCVEVPCPVGAINWPDCECAQSLEGAGPIIWSDDEGLYSGLCTVGDCPAHSINYPDCTCIEGFFSIVETDPINKHNITTCMPCPSGSWSAAGASSCYSIACPSSSNGWPNCKCNSGFSGTISALREGKFFGTCEPCAKGFWSTGDGDCKLVECPAHATDAPDCKCDSGFQGELSYQNGVWSGECRACHIGYHSAPGKMCEPMECPPYSKGWPYCACESGTEGTISFATALEFYTGSCTKCQAGYGSQLAQSNATDLQAWTSTSTCVRVVCPKESDGWPACACPEGTEGALELIGSAWVGSCTRCQPGFVSHFGEGDSSAQRICVSATCPLNSGSHPLCGCNPGFSGHIVWNSKAQIYEGFCVPCEPGTFSNIQGSKACSPCQPGSWSKSQDISCNAVVPCPANSTRSVDGHCNCNPGHAGSVVFDAPSGRFVGACDLCPRGYFTERGSLQCSKVDCVEGSINHPFCSCPVGQGGIISWNATVGKFSGACVACKPGELPVDGRCLRAPCPGNAEAMDAGCRCTNNTRGAVMWDVKLGQYTGICSPCWTSGYTVSADRSACATVDCPAGAEGFPNCRCSAGLNGSISWNQETQQWVGQCSLCPDGQWSRADGSTSVCLLEDCPAGISRRNPAGTDCGCLDGFEGLLHWDAVGGEWRGGCTQHGCPPHSSKDASGRCKCNAGFGGVLKAYDDGIYEGYCVMCQKGFLRNDTACTKTDCPSSSEGWPDCRCSKGNAGSVSWSYSEGFTADCRQCPRGFVSSRDGFSCRRVACPRGSLGHPDCACHAPLAGHIEWNGAVGSYTGACDSCAVGYAPTDSGCVFVDCSSGNEWWPRCRCTGNTVGQVRWRGSDYADDCAACPIGTAAINGSLCGAVPLPLHSRNTQQAVCVDGYQGTIEWNPLRQQWVGQCAPCPVGFWSVEGQQCSPIACPKATLLVPQGPLDAICLCALPLEGFLRFSSGEWVGECYDGESLQQRTPPRVVVDEPVREVSPLTPSMSPTPSPFPPGSCYERLSLGTCPVSCISSAVSGGRYNPKQCCDHECWCVDAEGSELRGTRGDEEAANTACLGINCLTLDDASRCISTVGSKASLGLYSQDHVVEGWVKPNLGPTDEVEYPVVGSEDISAVPLTYGFKKVYGLLRPFMRLGANALISNSSIDADKWMHVAFSYRASTHTFAIFVDGVEIASKAIVTIADGADDAVTFGFYQGASVPHFFFGSLGSIRIWNLVADVAVIKALSLSTRNLDTAEGFVVQYAFADNGLGQPQMTVRSADPTTGIPLIQCASPFCAVGDYNPFSFDMESLSPSPSPSPSRPPPPTLTPSPSPSVYRDVLLRLNTQRTLSVHYQDGVDLVVQ